MVLRPPTGEMNGVHTSVWPFPSTALDCTLALQPGNKHTLTDLHLTLVASSADERVCQQTWSSLTAKRPPPLAGLSSASAEQDLAAECSGGVILPSGRACLPPTILNHSFGNWKLAAFSACNTTTTITNSFWWPKNTSPSCCWMVYYYSGDYG